MKNLCVFKPIVTFGEKAYLKFYKDDVQYPFMYERIILSGNTLVIFILVAFIYLEQFLHTCHGLPFI